LDNLELLTAGFLFNYQNSTYIYTNNINLITEIRDNQLLGFFFIPYDMSRPNWVELTRGPGDFKYKVSRLPPEYDNKECAFGMGMFAKKDYAKGEVMWVDYYFLIPNEPGKILVEYHTTEVRSPSLTSNHKGDVVETGEQDIIMHTIQRHATDQREVYFDCYCNSSCNPNLQIVSLGDHEDGSSGAFATVCAREIKKGDQLHNCYDLLEWDCKDKGIPKVARPD
jgi:hypothetical protein